MWSFWLIRINYINIPRCRQIMMSLINLEAVWTSVSVQRIKLFNSYRFMISMGFFFRSHIRAEIKICYFFSNITSKLPTADKRSTIKKSCSETEWEIGYFLLLHRKKLRSWLLNSTINKSRPLSKSTFLLKFARRFNDSQDQLNKEA